jgi:hypothetical protein
MNLVRIAVLGIALTTLVGCGGEPAKGTATPSANAAAKPPSGSTTVTNADGTTSETTSAGKVQDPVE